MQIKVLQHRIYITVYIHHGKLFLAEFSICFFSVIIFCYKIGTNGKIKSVCLKYILLLTLSVYFVDAHITGTARNYAFVILIKNYAFIHYKTFDIAELISLCKIQTARKRSFVTPDFQAAKIISCANLFLFTPKVERK